VAAVDGQPVPGAPVPAATLPRLRRRHVRWLVARPVAVAVLAVTGAAAVTALLAPGVLPSHRDLLWSPHASLVLAGNAAVAWSIVLLHELAHLLTARAHGVPGRLGLGTRLQFLVAQTDVSGIWAAPRSARLTVYLAGMAVNVVVASVAVLVHAAAAPGTVADRAAAGVLLLAVLPLPVQFLVFMRTDVYFVLQDVAGARNLYADGAAYARWWLRRAARRPGVDPSLALPARERRAVRWYALLLVVGTAACLAVAATVTVPFTLALLVDAAGGLRPGGDPVDRFDAAGTAAVAAPGRCGAGRGGGGTGGGCAPVVAPAWPGRRRWRGWPVTSRREGGERRGADRHSEAGQGGDDQCEQPQRQLSRGPAGAPSACRCRRRGGDGCRRPPRR
ncbi:hypothetical protein ACFPZ4_33675, partial [Micromonospora harpali]